MLRLSVRRPFEKTAWLIIRNLFLVLTLQIYISLGLEN